MPLTPEPKVAEALRDLREWVSDLNPHKQDSVITTLEEVVKKLESLKELPPKTIKEELEETLEWVADAISNFDGDEDHCRSKDLVVEELNRRVDRAEMHGFIVG
jgi:hypothetical protein